MVTTAQDKDAAEEKAVLLRRSKIQIQKYRYTVSLSVSVFSSTFHRVSFFVSIIFYYIFKFRE